MSKQTINGSASSLVELNEGGRPALHHYSQNIVTDIRSSDPSERGCGCYKPAGFWVSVDQPDEDGESYGWPDWCRDEDFSLENLEIRHRVHLFDTERLLWITTADDLIWFDKTFSVGSKDYRLIDWPLVANQFAGVVIAPYQWSQRHEIHWYYGWDCASGVIWDASVIQRIAACDHDEQKAAHSERDESGPAARASLGGTYETVG